MLEAPCPIEFFILSMNHFNSRAEPRRLASGVSVPIGASSGQVRERNSIWTRKGSLDSGAKRGVHEKFKQGRQSMTIEGVPTNDLKGPSTA
jgi:hypothetical protein